MSKGWNEERAREALGHTTGSDERDHATEAVRYALNKWPAGPLDYLLRRDEAVRAKAPKPKEASSTDALIALHPLARKMVLTCLELHDRGRGQHSSDPLVAAGSIRTAAKQADKRASDDPYLEAVAAAIAVDCSACRALLDKKNAAAAEATAVQAAKLLHMQKVVLPFPSSKGAYVPGTPGEDATCDTSPSSLTSRLASMETFQIQTGTCFPFLPSLLRQRLFCRLAQTPPKLPQFLIQRKRSLRPRQPRLPRSSQPHRPRCCPKWTLQHPGSSSSCSSSLSSSSLPTLPLPLPRITIPNFRLIPSVPKFGGGAAKMIVKSPAVVCEDPDDSMSQVHTLQAELEEQKRVAKAAEKAARERNHGQSESEATCSLATAVI
jgi:hypothetical protein